MKKNLFIMSLALLIVGCGPSENDVRSIVQSELAKASKRTVITNAEIFATAALVQAPVIGPYNPAVRVGNLLFVSGQIGLDPQTGQLAGSSIETQTRQALQNLGSILSGAGFDSSQVVQCSVFLKDINDFQKMNLVYGGYFSEAQYPTRTTVEVSNLPRNAIIEIAAIAYKSEKL